MVNFRKPYTFCVFFEITLKFSFIVSREIISHSLFYSSCSLKNNVKLTGAFKLNLEVSLEKTKQ